MARISKKRFSKRLFLLAIIITAILATFTVGVVILSSGVRYTTYPTSEHGEIKFIGAVDDNEMPIRGTVYFADGLTAKIEPAKSSTVSSTIKGENGETVNVYSLKLTYSNGDVYEGETVYFLRHGKGKMTYSGGDIYEGDFVFNNMEGYGSYYYLGGDSYEGEFVDNQKNGEGIFKWAPDEYDRYDCYVGSYQNDLRSGKGTYTYADGTVFEGYYANDAKNGKGTLKFANGDTYEGDFVNDYRTGSGAYTWFTGDQYVGDFYRNTITGYGSYTWNERGDRRDYTGYFENGRIVLIEETPSYDNETGGTEASNEDNS